MTSEKDTFLQPAGFSAWQLTENAFSRNVQGALKMRALTVVVKFLAQRGLPFRGDNQVIGSKHNGSFFSIVELIAQFDPFLQKHFKEYGNAGRGTLSVFYDCRKVDSIDGCKSVFDDHIPN